MSFNIQNPLHDELVELVPLQLTDFEVLYEVASDPLIWEQHPNKDRYKLEVFKIFFDGAIQSKGAFLVVDKTSGEVIGCTRYYDFDEDAKSILIGYTFIAKEFWGKGYNKAIKTLMFDYAFKFVDKIILHIGATNVRSNRSIKKTGAKKIDEIEVAYYGEEMKLNFVYQLDKPI